MKTLMKLFLTPVLESLRASARGFGNGLPDNPGYKEPHMAAKEEHYLRSEFSSIHGVNWPIG